MNGPPYLKPAAGIGFSQLLDGTAFCLLHGGLLHHVIHPNLFQGCLRVSEHAVDFAEDVPVLLRQGVEQLPEKLDADLAVHGLLRRNGEHKQSNEIKELLKDKNHDRHITNTIRFDYLPRTSRKYDPAVFFELHFRIVRFPISDTACETIITNLDASAFPLHDIKRLYAMRWGIETSFRNLKHTLGLLHLHAKKVEFVLQEIFAKLTMYNFCELITQSVVIRQAQKTHTYKVNFSDAVHICRQFFLGDVPPPILEAMLMRYISPIRPDRKDTRKLTQKPSVSFTFRVA